MSKKTENRSIEAIVSEFKEYVQASQEYVIEACKSFVDCINADTKNREKFIAACPEISPETWTKFEAIGRGTMHIRLLYSGGIVFKRMQMLAISVQNDIFENGVEYLTANNDKLIVRFESITPNIAKQIFSPNGTVRNLPAQRAWLEERKNSVNKPEPNLPTESKIEIKNGKLCITGSAELDKKDMLKYLAKMV